jgi:hypothetical protein
MRKPGRRGDEETRKRTTNGRRTTTDDEIYIRKPGSQEPEQEFLMLEPFVRGRRTAAIGFGLAIAVLVGLAVAAKSIIVEEWYLRDLAA